MKTEKSHTCLKTGSNASNCVIHTVCFQMLKITCIPLWNVSYIFSWFEPSSTFIRLKFWCSPPLNQTFFHYRNKYCLPGTQLCFALTIHSSKATLRPHLRLLLSRCHTSTWAVFQLSVQYLWNTIEQFLSKVKDTRDLFKYRSLT